MTSDFDALQMLPELYAKERKTMFFIKKKENSGKDSPAANAVPFKENREQKEILILGLGCVKCNEMEKNTKKAVEELNLSENVRHVTDLNEIVGYGVVSIPALVIDGAVISTGRVLSVSEIKEALKQYRKV